MVDFVEICNVSARKAIIEAAKRIFNSDEVCRSYIDFNFGVTFFGTQCITAKVWRWPYLPVFSAECISYYVLLKLLYGANDLRSSSSGFSKLI